MEAQNWWKTCLRSILKTAMLCDTVAVVKPRPRGCNRERWQATLWIRQHAYESADAWSISRSTSPQLVHVATGEGNVRYYYFGVSSNFRRFNFQHAVAVRKLNPFENNRLYGICMHAASWNSTKASASLVYFHIADKCFGKYLYLTSSNS